ncbi:MAG TPA: co-chaperone GroES [Phycisphaerae bacterium]|nr:co-chaperone GroES [Phycisphaerae bacterium]
MAKPKMKPLGDKVIVKRLEANDVTAGGIFLPESAKEKPKRGIIQAVGPGRVTDTGERGKMQLSKNDQVLFTSYAGTEVEVGGEEYLIMSESDILAVVE